MRIRKRPIRHFGEGQLRPITVSYARDDSVLVTSRVGYGMTYDEALVDADRQLPNGVWKRLTCSTPASVLDDLGETRASRIARLLKRRGEGEVITVEGNTVTVWHE